MTFRKADIGDIEQLIRIRKIQLQAEGQKPDVNIDEDLRRVYNEKMRTDDLIEWVAEDENGEVIATAAVLFMDFLPAFNNPAGKRGYVTNVYTMDAYRRKGIAGKLMQELEDEALKHGVAHLVLHASEMGRKVYGKYGYLETHSVMEKHL